MSTRTTLLKSSSWLSHRDSVTGYILQSCCPLSELIGDCRHVTRWWIIRIFFTNLSKLQLPNSMIRNSMLCFWNITYGECKPPLRKRINSLFSESAGWRICTPACCRYTAGKVQVMQVRDRGIAVNAGVCLRYTAGSTLLHLSWRRTDHRGHSLTTMVRRQSVRHWLNRLLNCSIWSLHTQK